MTRIDNTRRIKAPHGPELSAKSWLSEAPMRMLMNNLDAEVAERPEELVVYGGIGRAARDWESFDKIVATLKRLEDDETPARAIGQACRRVQDACGCAARADRQFESGAALGELGHVSGTRSQGADDVRPDDGRLVDLYRQPGHRAGHLRDLRRDGPAAIIGGDLKGKWILTAGLGGMGGAQPLAATMAGASMLAIECQPSRIEMRLKTRYLDEATQDAGSGARHDRSGQRATSTPVSVGLLGNAAEVLPELVKRGIKPDAVTDQTSAHDPVNGYLPTGWTLDEWMTKRESDPKAVERAARASMAVHVRAMLDFHKQGHSDLRLWQQHPPDGVRGRRDAMPSTFRVLCRPISAPCSARASARSAGPRFRAIPRTSPRPMPRSRN